MDKIIVFPKEKMNREQCWKEFMEPLLQSKMKKEELTQLHPNDLFFQSFQ